MSLYEILKKSLRYLFFLLLVNFLSFRDKNLTPSFSGKGFDLIFHFGKSS
ncbi:hypothetical protein HMPREF9444_00072 [Succinatimonas hippei YIT 12066]|uniref:Uncharacterized protein n=1 Tax=Succinatimonas hippei (strain DSM 22608 / JCM 16073 / KCTC 15190 / YIT 12066) TaxID=762983 RepID=E8LHB4_SUCHY|nr:hypothetical protein HMPREF9444_00072 [Succinatimonas hippei YIT 12066]